MKKSWFFAAALVSLSLAAPSAVRADLVYENAPFSLPQSVPPAGKQVSESYEVTNSFTVSGKYNLTSAEVLLWVTRGQTLQSLSWRIGTDEFLDDVTSGSTTEIDSTLTDESVTGYDIYATTFAISGLVDGLVDVPDDEKTTYWFTLSGASATSGIVYWSVNYGDSLAAFRIGSGNGESTAPEAFRIYGDLVVPAVPEPASLTLLGLGVGCGLLVHRRRKAATA